MVDEHRLDLAALPERRLRRLHPGDPLRRRGRLPGAREVQADPQRRRPAAGGAGGRRARRRCTASPTRSSRSATAACPGYDVEVIGTDADVDRRLSAVAEIDIPFYRGLKIGVPTLPGLVEALAEGRYDLVHLVSPGPAGIGAWLLARVLELPVVGSYHTELAAYAGLRSGMPQLEAMAGDRPVGLLRRLRRRPLAEPRQRRAAAPSWASPSARSARWDRGVDLERFDPALRSEGPLPGEVNVLYAGPADPGEGRRSAGRRLSRRARARPAAAPGAGRRRSGGGPPARAPRRARHVPGLARRPGPGPRLRQRRRVPVRQPH